MKETSTIMNMPVEEPTGSSKLFPNEDSALSLPPAPDLAPASDESNTSKSSNSDDSDCGPVYTRSQDQIASPTDVVVVVDEARVQPETNSAVSDRDSKGVAWKKHVAWGDLEMRKFLIRPGDHPDCSLGCPVSLEQSSFSVCLQAVVDRTSSPVRCTVPLPSYRQLTIEWDPCREVTTSIDEYEAVREGLRYSQCPRVSWIERRQRLRRLGFSDDDMHAAQDASEAARRNRERTVSRLKFARVEELQQSLMRKFGRTMHPKVALETKYPIREDSSV